MSKKKFARKHHLSLNIQKRKFYNRSEAISNDSSNLVVKSGDFKSTTEFFNPGAKFKPQHSDRYKRSTTHEPIFFHKAPPRRHRAAGSDRGAPQVRSENTPVLSQKSQKSSPGYQFSFKQIRQKRRFNFQQIKPKSILKRIKRRSRSDDSPTVKSRPNVKFESQINFLKKLKGVGRKRFLKQAPVLVVTNSGRSSRRSSKKSSKNDSPKRRAKHAKIKHGISSKKSIHAKLLSLIEKENLLPALKKGLRGSRIGKPAKEGKKERVLFRNRKHLKGSRSRAEPSSPNLFKKKAGRKPDFSHRPHPAPIEHAIQKSLELPRLPQLKITSPLRKQT